MATGHILFVLTIICLIIFNSLALPFSERPRAFRAVDMNQNNTALPTAFGIVLEFFKQFNLEHC